jgi:hypothetical protein
MNNVRTIHSPLPAPLFRDCPDCGFTGWSQRAHLSANEFRSFNDQIEHRRPKKTMSSCIAPAQHWYRCMSSTADF